MSDWLVNPPGWYGKVTFLGDFASRRLDADFIARWDEWLQDVIAASRDRLGALWLDRYLTSPVWRFVECADTGATHAGVLMPSVDKVGRYFPLCMAVRLSHAPRSGPEEAALDDWLGDLEAIAVSTLRAGLDTDRLDRRLMSLEPPEVASGHGTLPRSFAISPGLSFWWTGTGPLANPSSFSSLGLPRIDQFLTMLQTDTAAPGTAPRDDDRTVIDDRWN